MSAEAAKKRATLADALYAAPDTKTSLRLILGMGLQSYDVSPALGVDSQEVLAWVVGVQESCEEHEMAIGSLKAITMFFLKRGELSTSGLAAWLAEPNVGLKARTPLQVLPTEGGIDAILNVGATFVTPEPI